MSDYSSDSSDLSDEDKQLCPLCCEPMDETDLKLFPCPCNFQVGEVRASEFADLFVVFEDPCGEQPSMPQLSEAVQPG